MFKGKIRVLENIGKEIINTGSGASLGRVHAFLADETGKKILKVVVRPDRKDKNSFSFDIGNVGNFGVDCLVVSEEPHKSVYAAGSGGTDLMGRNVISRDGTLIGSIVDFVFEPEKFAIPFLVLRRQGDDSLRVISNDESLRFGKDVIVFDGSADEAGLADAGDEYKGYDFDEMLARARRYFDEAEERFRRWEEKISSEGDDGVRKKMEELKSGGEEFGRSMAETADKLFDETKNMVAAWRTRLERAGKVEKAGNRIYEELLGSEAACDIRDNDGVTIIAAGSKVTEDVIAHASEAGKLSELVKCTVKEENREA